MRLMTTPYQVHESELVQELSNKRAETEKVEKAKAAAAISNAEVRATQYPVTQ
jgi:IS5 family transposase